MSEVVSERGTLTHRYAGPMREVCELIGVVLDAEAIHLTETSGADLRPTTSEERDHEKEVP